MSSSTGFGVLSQLRTIGYDTDLAIAAVADTNGLDQAHAWLQVYAGGANHYDGLRMENGLGLAELGRLFERSIDRMAAMLRETGVPASKLDELKYALEQSDKSRGTAEHNALLLTVLRRLDTYALCTNVELEGSVMMEREALLDNILQRKETVNYDGGAAADRASGPAAPPFPPPGARGGAGASGRRADLVDFGA